MYVLQCLLNLDSVCICFLLYLFYFMHLSQVTICFRLDDDDSDYENDDDDGSSKLVNTFNINLCANFKTQDCRSDTYSGFIVWFI